MALVGFITAADVTPLATHNQPIFLAYIRKFFTTYYVYQVNNLLILKNQSCLHLSAVSLANCQCPSLNFNEKLVSPCLFHSDNGDIIVIISSADKRTSWKKSQMRVRYFVRFGNLSRHFL